MDRMRSWMFVPGNSIKMIEKAFAGAADAIMLDLEDGVVPEQKPAARIVVADAIGRLAERSPPCCYCRVNGAHTSDLAPDLASVVVPGLRGITLAKVETVDQVRAVADSLDQLERSRGIGAGTVRMMLAIETARGLFAAPSLAAASPRVSGLMFGAEDFSTDVGLPTVRSGMARDFLYARSMIVYAAVSAGVIPVDAVWPELRDLDGLRHDAQAARALGFLGKSMVHPGHIDVVNEVFTPSATEVDFSLGLIAEFEKAVNEGKGSISYAGKLVDRPIYARALATVKLAQRISA
jgi:citrate lyase subunit beta / citryl-CoA lyase